MTKRQAKEYLGSIVQVCGVGRKEELLSSRPNSAGKLVKAFERRRGVISKSRATHLCAVPSLHLLTQQLTIKLVSHFVSYNTSYHKLVIGD